MSKTRKWAWITWETQRRSLELASRLGCRGTFPIRIRTRTTCNQNLECSGTCKAGEHRTPLNDSLVCTRAVRQVGASHR